MADAKTNRSQTSAEGGQAVAKREREHGTIQPRNAAGGWLSTPFEVMNRMAEEMDRTFDRMFRDFGVRRQSEISMQAPPAEATRGRRLEIKEVSESGDTK